MLMLLKMKRHERRLELKQRAARGAYPNNGKPLHKHGEK